MLSSVFEIILTRMFQSLQIALPKQKSPDRDDDRRQENAEKNQNEPYWKLLHIHTLS